jgi:tetratricopeptide (TPR) repeat protein
MPLLYQKLPLILLLAGSALFVNAQSDSLDNYIKRLRLSQASGGSETAFMSTGSDFLYGQDYFDAGNYSSAAYYFQAIVRKEKDHPYANYQLAIALWKQNDPEKAKLAQIALANSFKAMPALKERYEKDMPGKTAAAEEPKPDVPPAQKPAISGNKGLDAYIGSIKYSRSTGGAATVMLSAGLDAFYGIEYFEKAGYRSAETHFTLSLSKDPANPYVNYLKAVSMAAQGKTNEAKPFLAKAIAGDASLENRFTAEAAVATEKWNLQKEANQITTTPSHPVKYGGPLVYGNYTCHVSVWNGPNVSPAYRFDYKGYFALKKDGSYRWLDDGATGKFTYNATTGEVDWLSGYFKGFKPKITQYQPGDKTAQITIIFSDSYRWECGCDK